MNTIRTEIEGKLKRHFGATLRNATNQQLYQAVALTVRDRIMEKVYLSKKEQKRLYYLSFEFLPGRLLGNNIMNLMANEEYNECLKELNTDIRKLEETENDAGLGNGGLGRLASCFLSSLTNLRYQAYGCGIRYELGLFQQKISDGFQVELPDAWLWDGSVWEIAKPEEQVTVKFMGRLESRQADNRIEYKLKDEVNVLAMPYDVPVVGYDSNNVNLLRLWSARSANPAGLSVVGRSYMSGEGQRDFANDLTKVLYPDDNTYEGKTLRLKQQYFFTSATMQWIVNDFKKQRLPLRRLPDYMQIHINDTHPTVAIAELMRILLDQEGFSWNEAWNIVTRIFAYTNHTVMSEALECWDTHMFESIIPRVFMIICEISRRQYEDNRIKCQEDMSKISQMAIVWDNQIRMANLCLHSCHSINGVSELHTDILKKNLFKSFYEISPFKFNSITNGIDHRRWLNYANPGLAALITESIGDEWIKSPEKLTNLNNFATDKSFIDKFREIKRDNKVVLADYIKENSGVLIDPDSIFDVHVKRLHEYKRQLLNILHVIYDYHMLLDNPDMQYHPKTYIFGGKSAPSYNRAKMIIKLINTVAQKINSDTRLKSKLRVVFIENYGVHIAEKIIPATEVSEQISTAGKEASGTGNMKFMMNGALTIGTLDGANVEMMEKVGAENIYICGLRADEVDSIYRYGNSFSTRVYENNEPVRRVLDSLINGEFECGIPNIFMDLYNSIRRGDNGFPDPYMLLNDFESYTDTHDLIQSDYQNPTYWNTMAIKNVAASGYFSSDRSIEDYNAKIWKLRAW